MAMSSPTQVLRFAFQLPPLPSMHCLLIPHEAAFRYRVTCVNMMAMNSPTQVLRFALQLPILPSMHCLVIPHIDSAMW